MTRLRCTRARVVTRALKLRGPPADINGVSTSRLTKIAFVGLPAALLLSLGDRGLGRALAIVAGAALIGFAWSRFERRAAPPAAPSGAQAGERHDRERRTASDRRIDRTPTGRGRRDVRCPARTRATARARRSR